MLTKILNMITILLATFALLTLELDKCPVDKFPTTMFSSVEDESDPRPVLSDFLERLCLVLYDTHLLWFTKN